MNNRDNHKEDKIFLNKINKEDKNMRIFKKDKYTYKI